MRRCGRPRRGRVHRDAKRGASSLASAYGDWPRVNRTQPCRRADPMAYGCLLMPNTSPDLRFPRPTGRCPEQEERGMDDSSIYEVIGTPIPERQARRKVFF